MPRRPKSLLAKLGASKAPRRPVPWWFRLVVPVLSPVVFFLLLELILRVTGFGSPTFFLLAANHHGQEVFVQNNRFGWRFFGPDQAPQPACFAFPQKKATNTIRIFVFGESAAFGDPQPEFGLPRLLQATLNLRYPGTRFEVINAAMTGINSHTVLSIARDCAQAEGDIWVIYMGNNEIVGPFGTGTIFGPQAPALALVRGSLALKSTRTGQLLDQALRLIERSTAGAEQSEWGGMMMFLNNQVRADDPRLDRTHQHFERNLEDILQAGRKCGAGIVVSTVAVNLKDCAPFASAPRPGLKESDRAKWKELYQHGIETQQARRWTEAAGWFDQAAQLDDSVAELQFRRATVALAAGDFAVAQRLFALARDLDTLRFRCDGPLNAITRRAAAAHPDERILLADAEAVFARQSHGGLPGDNYFYEHVHLTFEGNYLLARTLAEEVEKLLPDRFRHGAAPQPWPTPEDCARRVAWTDATRLAGLTEIQGRLHDPPFIHQLDHGEQVRRLAEQVSRLRLVADASSDLMEPLFSEALTAAPEDPVLYSQHAAWLAASGDLTNAVRSARRTLELLPHSAEAWGQLGHVLVQQEQFREAAEAFAAAFRCDPDNFWALQNLAQAHAKLGRHGDAMREYRRAIRMKPRFGMAYFGLGQLLEAEGRKAEAEENFRLALKHRLHRAAELTTLARFCHQRGWLADAVTNYLDAIKLNGSEASLHLGAGQCLAALGRPAEAAPYFAEASRLAPRSAEACFLLGLDLGRQGKAAEAGEQFAEAVRLKPELIEARVNLGVALINQGREAEALGQFEEVLRQSPTNAVALRYLRKE
jgi:tetratricopeptide (TPR) repeat protein